MTARTEAIKTARELLKQHASRKTIIAKNAHQRAYLKRTQAMLSDRADVLLEKYEITVNELFFGDTK